MRFIRCVINTFICCCCCCCWSLCCSRTFTICCCSPTSGLWPTVGITGKSRFQLGLPGGGGLSTLGAEVWAWSWFTRYTSSTEAIQKITAHNGTRMGTFLMKHKIISVTKHLLTISACQYCGMGPSGGLRTHLHTVHKPTHRYFKIFNI